MRHRRGFTLIELLVVMAIISILIGLLLPAIQKIRESASLVQCQNNLKQIGVALHDFHQVRGHFPAGYVSAVAADGSDLGPGWGWAAYLLPYLEQDNQFKRINFKANIGDPVNAVPRTYVMPVFRCPSDDAPTTFTAAQTNVTVAFSDYVGMFGTPEITANPGAGNGVFYRNSRIRFLDMRDGTSTTILVGERHSYLAFSTWTGAVTGAVVPPNHPSPLGPEGAAVLCLGHTGSAAERHTPNNPTNHVDDFGSFHPQGSNFLFGDGSVRFVAQRVNPATWVALGTRAGGEEVSGEEF